MVTPEKSTPPPPSRSTSAGHRGKHELLADYLNRIDLQPLGRHENRLHYAGMEATSNKLVAAYAPDSPEGIARMEADVRAVLKPDIKLKGELSFSDKLKHAKITSTANYMHTTGRQVVEGPHPSWSIDPCPYPDDHKSGCTWWTGTAWVKTGIRRIEGAHISS